MSEDTAQTTEDSVLDNGETPSSFEDVVSLSDDALDSFISKYGSTDNDNDDNDEEIENKDIETKESKTSDEPVKEKQDLQDNEKSDNTVPKSFTQEDVLKAFKANGKEFKPNDLKELRTLAQKGLNYESKMKGIKDQQKTIQSITNANISKEDLNFLIDVHKGDKEAIKQLLKKHNVETYSLDLDDIKYTGGNNIPNDKESMLQETIDRIKEAPYRNELSKVLLEEWDSKSKDYVFQNPEWLEAIRQEFESGQFQEINAQIEREKILDKLNIPHLARYKQLYDERTGTVNNTDTQSKEQEVEQDDVDIPKNTKAKKTGDKKGVASHKSKPAKAKETIAFEDISRMSDKELDAFISKQG